RQPRSAGISDGQPERGHRSSAFVSPAPNTSGSSVEGAFRASRWSVMLALAFFALHLPFLPASLEDLDSINFALGMRHFDVAAHQPHPPGYPLFIVLAKAVHLVVPSEANALSLVSIVAGSLSVFALVALYS